MAKLAVVVSWEILKGSQDFLHTFSMVLSHKWDVKNGFPFVLQFFSLISDGLGGVQTLMDIIKLLSILSLLMVIIMTNKAGKRI